MISVRVCRGGRVHFGDLVMPFHCDFHPLSHLSSPSSFNRKNTKLEMGGGAHACIPSTQEVEGSWFHSQPGLHSEFHSLLTYEARPYPRNTITTMKTTASPWKKTTALTHECSSKWRHVFMGRFFLFCLDFLSQGLSIQTTHLIMFRSSLLLFNNFHTQLQKERPGQVSLRLQAKDKGRLKGRAGNVQSTSMLPLHF